MIKVYEFIKKNRTLSIICAVILGLGSIAMLYSFIINLLDVYDMTTLFLAILVGVFCGVLIWTTVSVIKNIVNNRHN